MVFDPELVGGRPHYRYYVAWTISGDLSLELNFTGVTWTRMVRRAGSFQGTLTFNSGDTETTTGRTDATRLIEAFSGTMPGKMSLYVMRDNVPVWGGIISRRTYSAADGTLSVEATGFESYFYRRMIWHTITYSNTLDQYAVVRNLIAVMQLDFLSQDVPTDIVVPHPGNSNIGLTVSQINSGKHQDSQVWLGYSLQNFGDALEGFSNNLNGFEYNVVVGFDKAANKFTKELKFRDTPPSQLPLGAVYTGERTGIEQNYFEYPGNILSIGYDDSVDNASTRYYVTGKQPEPIGETELPIPRGVFENEALLATQWPLFEVVESSEHGEVSSQATLNSYAKTYGQRTRPPTPTWTVTVNGDINPRVGSYVPGDWCSLVVTDPFITQGINPNGEQTQLFTKRIAEFSVEVPDTEQYPEVVTLTLIDEWDSDVGGG